MKAEKGGIFMGGGQKKKIVKKVFMGDLWLCYYETYSLSTAKERAALQLAHLPGEKDGENSSQGRNSICKILGWLFGCVRLGRGCGGRRAVLVGVSLGSQ